MAQYKTIDLKSKVTDIDDKGLVKIRVSAFNNIDSYGDIMSPTAFNKSISDFNRSDYTRIKHLKNHDHKLLLGYPIEMTASKEGLDVVSRMNLKTLLPYETFSMYKFFAEGGQTLEHSIGYVVVKEDKSEIEGANVLKEVNLYEYSTLDFLGANSATPLIDLKSEGIIKTESDLIRYLKLKHGRV